MCQQQRAGAAERRGGRQGAARFAWLTAGRMAALAKRRSSFLADVLLTPMALQMEPGP